MMKTLHKILLTLIVSFSLFSCFDDWQLMSCIEHYSVSLKIDGKKNDEVTVEYIGPNRKVYGENLFDSDFEPKEVKIPYAKITYSQTKCSGKDFKKNGYNFLKITNKSSEPVYICAVIHGKETNENNYKKYFYIRYLIRVYNNQDEDPNYDYTKDFTNVEVNYMDRYELYEKLFQDKYPYIIKLPAGKTCIMKWGDIGFEMVE